MVDGRFLGNCSIFGRRLTTPPMYPLYTVQCTHIHTQSSLAVGLSLPCTSCPVRSTFSWRFWAVGPHAQYGCVSGDLAPVLLLVGGGGGGGGKVRRDLDPHWNKIGFSSVLIPHQGHRLVTGSHQHVLYKGLTSTSLSIECNA